MNEVSNLAQVQQLLESVEKDLQSAKQIVQQLISAVPEAGSETEKEAIAERAKNLNVLEGGKVIEGVFDGQNMVGPDGRIYPVPANYASKSKLVEGDVLKLTIAPDGSFIYKQIGPVERKRILGVMVQDEKGDYRVIAEGKSCKVLLASLTYYKGEPGDQVTLLVPTGQDSSWAAVENVIKQGSSNERPSTGPIFTPDEDIDNDEPKQVRILADDE